MSLHRSLIFIVNTLLQQSVTKKNSKSNFLHHQSVGRIEYILLTGILNQYKYNNMVQLSITSGFGWEYSWTQKKKKRWQ